MTESKHQEYDYKLVTLCEAVWGKGYISPGGTREVERIVGDTVLEGKQVLDVGCGSGGISRFLTTRFSTGHITGVDVDAYLVGLCRQQAGDAGLADKVSYHCIEPGPLPFSDESFDIVFTKDSLIHIKDKTAICQEVYRVLRDGGEFIASDWMCSEDPITPEMQRYIELEELGFGMGNQRQYYDALFAAGFQEIQFTDRNAWYRDLAREEHSLLAGELYDELVADVGRDFTDHNVEIWAAMCVVLDRGELRPTHWAAKKPG